MRHFRKYKIWQSAHQLTLTVYSTTSGFPRSEVFGLTSQLRNSVSSIGANFAEGCARGSDADFARFLRIALGSAFETENHILLASDLGYLDDEISTQLLGDIVEIKRMLIGLIKKLKSEK